jgi:hypothetical protein
MAQKDCTCKGVWVMWLASTTVTITVFDHISKAHKYLLESYPTADVKIETWGEGLVMAYVKGEEIDNTYYIEYRKIL